MCLKPIRFGEGLGADYDSRFSVIQLRECFLVFIKAVASYRNDSDTLKKFPQRPLKVFNPNMGKLDKFTSTLAATGFIGKCPPTTSARKEISVFLIA